MLNQSAPVIYSVTNLLWSDTFTGGHVKWIVSAIWGRAITLSQKKWFVLFWMCDFIALTRCCKRISFFTFNICGFITKFNKASRMPNIVRITWIGHAPFRENFYHARSAFQRRIYVLNLKSLAQAVFKIGLCLIPCQKFTGHVTSHAPLGKVIYTSSRHSTCEVTDEIWSL